jgi:hypothetical protein
MILKKNSLLELVDSKDFLVINPVDGLTTIVDAKTDPKVFHNVHSFFKEKILRVKSSPQPQTPVYVFALAGKGTIREVFESISSNIESLCLTQHQIVEFCSQYPHQIRPWKQRNNPGHSTHFIFKSQGEFYVAWIHIYGRSWYADALPLHDGCILSGKSDSPRFVVPTN